MGSSTAKVFCLWMLIFGLLALLVGSLAPYWLSVDTPGISVDYGLWFFCTPDKCATYAWTDFDWANFTTWFYVVHSLVGLATLVGIFLLLASLGSMCGDNANVSVHGAVALLTGLIGVAGAVVFFEKSAESMQVLAERRDWAFVLFFSGTAVTSVFGIVLMALPRSPRVDPI